MACVDTIATQYDGSMNDTSNFGTNANEYGQTFEVQEDIVMCGFSMKGSAGVSRSGGAGNMTLRIREGSVTGTIVYSQALSSSSFPAYTASPSFFDVILDATVDLTANTLYYISIEVNSGNANDEMRWSVDNTSPTYSYGSLWINGTQYSATDTNFKIYGAPVAVFAISGSVFLGATPIEGATVRCIRQSTNTTVSAQVTDADGLYTFSDLVEGALYHLCVEYEDVENVQYFAKSFWDIVPYEVV